MKNKIIPFRCVDDFELLMSKSTIESLLRDKGVNFCEEIWDNSDCTVPVNCIVLRAENGINFFFAKLSPASVWIINRISWNSILHMT